MSKFSILGASTALALSLALASPALAQGRVGGSHMAGAGHMSMGAAHFSGSGHMGMSGTGFAGRPGGYAAMGGSRVGPGAAVATGPRTGAWTGGRTAWTGGRTAWTGGRTAWTGGRTAYNGGYWRGGRWHHHRGWWPGAAFAAGAALGSYAYYGGPYDDYYYGDYGPDYDTGVAISVPAGGDAVAYCEQRFRSYDPASGTYLGYDGLRHPCP